MAIKDFIDIADFTPAQLGGLLDRALADKKLFRQGKLPASLPHKVLAMIFEKPSLRTRVSFETAMTHLGGHAISLTQSDIGLGQREPAQDAARVLGRICDGIMARTFSHQLVVDLAGYSPRPVINGLTDYSHPCQAMADIMTGMELRGDLKEAKLVFIGDGNNVARSLAMLCALLGIEFVLACPKGYEFAAEFTAGVKARCPQARLSQTGEPLSAVKGAAIVYTDTWVSMGQEKEKARRVKDFKGFQINPHLLAGAPKDALVMHCLPAYRGYEIAEESMEAHADCIFTEAENRLHFQRSLLAVLLGEGGIE
jgi:ornithine carbamoyltransferase